MRYALIAGVAFCSTMWCGNLSAAPLCEKPGYPSRALPFVDQHVSRFLGSKVCMVVRVQNVTETQGQMTTNDRATMHNGTQGRLDISGQRPEVVDWFLEHCGSWEHGYDWCNVAVYGRIAEAPEGWVLVPDELVF